MACSVDPFSSTTAELSKDYMKVFANPNIVPNYLEELGPKTGVTVSSADNCINVKGSWASLKRVRSLLCELVTTHHATPDDNNDIDLFDEDAQCYFSNEDSYTEEEQNNISDAARFHYNVDQASTWSTAKLSQIPITRRSKRPGEQSQAQTKANRIPEPVVLYANNQPTPDPEAKAPPTFEAINKVLKTVYTSKNRKTTESSESPSLIINFKREPTDPDEFFHENSSNLNAHGVESVTTLVSVDASEHRLEEADARLSSNISEDLGSLADVSFSPPNANSGRNRVLPHHQSSHEAKELDNTHSSQSETCLVRESEVVSRRKRKARKVKNSIVRTTKGNVDNKSDSLRKGDEKAVTNLEKKDTLVVTASEVTGTRRKGRPRKNPIYQNESSSLTQISAENAPSRRERHKPALRKSARHTETALPETSAVVKEKTNNRGSKQSTSQGVRVKKEGECYVCELCPYVAEMSRHLREHRRRVHIVQGKEFQCGECGKIFGYGKDLKRHYRSHQRAQHCCDICGKMYKEVRTLAVHKKTHESSYTKPEFPCEFCQKNFSTKYVLAYHIKSEHLGMKKTYLCPTCGKSFSQRNSYLQHANVHMGIKPYQCDVCGKSFSYDKSLKEHKHVHEKEKRFECSVCHKKFRQSTGVAIHMKIHKENKDYVCFACGKGFSQKQALIRHERIHVGEKPFACSLCKRLFTDSSVLRRHMILIHKKDKDKWQEDTVSRLQRRTDFFIDVVRDKTQGKDQNHHRGIFNNPATSSKSSLQNTARSSAATPTDSDLHKKSSHTKDDGEVNMPSVEISTAISVSQSQISSSLESVLPSVALPVDRNIKPTDSDSMMSVDNIVHGSVSAVEHAAQKLQETVFVLPSLQSSVPNPSFPQTVHLASLNESQISLPQDALGAQNSYTFSETSGISTLSISSNNLQNDESTAHVATHYSMITEQVGVTYHSNSALSEALASLGFHATNMNDASPQQETGEVPVPSSSVTQ